jgi:hypothetical protein
LWFRVETAPHPKYSLKQRLLFFARVLLYESKAILNVPLMPDDTVATLIVSVNKLRPSELQPIETLHLATVLVSDTKIAHLEFGEDETLTACARGVKPEKRSMSHSARGRSSRRSSAAVQPPKKSFS